MNGEGAYFFQHSEVFLLINPLVLHRRFERNFKGDVVARLVDRYPELSEEAKMKAFIRKWMYLFAYAELGFSRAHTSLYCWTFARPVSARFSDCVTSSAYF